MIRRLTFLSLSVILLLSLIVSGCSESTKPKPPVRGCTDCSIVSRTSPAAVLQDLRVYYSIMDDSVSSPEEAHVLAREYREILDPNFKFFFLAKDVPPGFPEGWWGREDEVMAFDSLMTKRALGIISDIKLAWSPAPAEPDNRLTTGPEPVLLHPGWMHIEASQIILDVWEGATDHQVNQGTADFYFGPDPADSTLWVLTEWWDRPSSSFSPGQGSGGLQLLSLVDPTTWGKIKVFYH